MGDLEQNPALEEVTSGASMSGAVPAVLSGLKQLIVSFHALILERMLLEWYRPTRSEWLELLLIEIMRKSNDGC